MKIIANVRDERGFSGQVVYWGEVPRVGDFLTVRENEEVLDAEYVVVAVDRMIDKPDLGRLEEVGACLILSKRNQ